MRLPNRIGLALVMGVWVSLVWIVFLALIGELAAWAVGHTGAIEIGLGLGLGLFFAWSTFLAAREV